MVENTFGILVSRFQVLLGIMEQRSRVVRGIVYTYVVLHNMLRTHQWTGDNRANPRNDGAALQISWLRVCQIRTTGILQKRPNINENY